MSYKPLTLILLIPLFLMAACLNFKPTDDPTRYYGLNALSIKEQKHCAEEQVLGIGWIEIPEYLDRIKIIKEIAENEYDVTEFHRWTESVKHGIVRVLTENLSSELQCFSVLPAPWKNLGKPDFELHINILDFKPQMFLCKTLLRARYSIINIKLNQPILSNEAHISIPICDGPDEYSSIVESMNQALAQFSKDIACRLKLQSFMVRSSTCNAINP